MKGMIGIPAPEAAPQRYRAARMQDESYLELKEGLVARLQMAIGVITPR